MTPNLYAIYASVLEIHNFVRQNAGGLLAATAAIYLALEIGRMDGRRFYRYRVYRPRMPRRICFCLLLYFAVETLVVRVRVSQPMDAFPTASNAEGYQP